MSGHDKNGKAHSGVAKQGGLVTAGYDLPTIRDGRYFTTGAIAKLCAVAPRTATKWFDAGIIEGVRIPGSTARRALRAEVIRFLRDNGYPAYLSDTPVVAALSDAVLSAAGCRVKNTSNVWDLATLVADDPTVACVLIDRNAVTRDAASLCVKRIADSPKKIQVVLVLSEDDDADPERYPAGVVLLRHPMGPGAMSTALSNLFALKMQAVPETVGGVLSELPVKKEGV